MDKETVIAIRTWAINKSYREQKVDKREALADDVAQFMAKGGEVKEIPSGISGLDYALTQGKGKDMVYANKRTARIFLNPPVPASAQKRGQVNRPVKV